MYADVCVFSVRVFAVTDSKLTIWDDIPMRHVDMHYQRDTSYLDVDMLRFVVDSALYDNRDPFFWGGPNKPTGFLELTSMRTCIHICHRYMVSVDVGDVWLCWFVDVPLIRYGAITPLFASRPFMWHADVAMRNLYNCTNCPSMADIDGRALDDIGTTHDIPPRHMLMQGGSSMLRFCCCTMLCRFVHRCGAEHG